MNKLIFLFVAFTILSLTNCEPDNQDECTISKNTPGNLIEETLEIDCFPDDTAQDNFHFTTLEEYEAAFSDCTLATVDFDQFDVLGIRSGASGCFRAYQPYVKENGDDIEYIIRVKECGGCEPWVTRIDWVTVPKILEIQNISFIVEKL